MLYVKFHIVGADWYRSLLVQSIKGDMSSTIAPRHLTLAIDQDAGKLSIGQICCNVTKRDMNSKPKRKVELSAIEGFQVINLRPQSPILS
jgi:hypothetical protein